MALPAGWQVKQLGQYLRDLPSAPSWASARPYLTRFAGLFGNPLVIRAAGDYPAIVVPASFIGEPDPVFPGSWPVASAPVPPLAYAILAPAKIILRAKVLSLGFLIWLLVSMFLIVVTLAQLGVVTFIVLAFVQSMAFAPLLVAQAFALFVLILLVFGRPIVIWFMRIWFQHTLRIFPGFIVEQYMKFIHACLESQHSVPLLVDYYQLDIATLRHVVRNRVDYQLPHVMAEFCSICYFPSNAVLARLVVALSSAWLLFLSRFISNVPFKVGLMARRLAFWTFACVILVLAVDIDILDRFLSLLVNVVTLPLALVLWGFGLSKGPQFTLAQKTKLVLVWLVLRVFRILIVAEIIVHRNVTVRGRLNKSSLRSIWSRTLMDLGKVVEAMDLPAMVRGLPLLLDADGVNKTAEIMEDLGWAPLQRVVPGVGPEASALPYTEWAAFHWLPAFGMRQARFYVDYELEELSRLAPSYFRTETYKTPLNEIVSTARYFNNFQYSYPDMTVDEVWPLVSDIFKNSQLTSFRHIIRKWEKRYGLGALWLDRLARRPRKLSRKSFIASIGGIRNLEVLWERTFMVAHDLVAINTVSVKGEALPFRKFVMDKVRTIIGSPLPQYISSTVWNYWSNHNFRPFSTPITIGLPLNGFNLSAIWAKHSRFHNTFAGDMSAFDSTLSGSVVELIAAIRKKGFENHTSAADIGYLIDRNYANILDAFLAVNSTATAYKKGTGLSTGHSSTSMDNSLGTVILYLLAWKELTGLNAYDFKHYNELTVYGDDHFISTMATAPSVWNFPNIQKTMAQWGVEIRREDPDKGLTGISFLGKFARRPTSADIAVFNRFGIPVPEFVIFHDKARLIGKAVAPVRILDRDYRIKRLLSYLSLTAFHPDVYDLIVGAITRISKKSNKVWTIPSYEKVLQDWYNPSTLYVEPDVEVGTDDDPFGEVSKVVQYGSMSFVDYIANFLSNVPDVMNPVIFNQGYIGFFNGLLGRYLSWPIALLAQQNNAFARPHLFALLQRTSYSFLADADSTLETTPRANPTSLLLRHWLFLLLRFNPTSSRFSLNWIDSFLRKFSVMAFAVTAEVQEEVRGFSFQFSNTLLVAALDFVHVPMVPWLSFFRLPNPSMLVHRLSSMLFNKFWTAVPPSFTEVNRVLPKFVGFQKPPLLITAPTGSGKSTALVTNVVLEIGYLYEHVVVIQPREILVAPLAQYLRSSFGVDCLAVSHNNPLTHTSHVYICTAAQAVLRGWINARNLILVDECHVDEPLYNFVFAAIKNWSVAAILMTATPTSANYNLAGRQIAIPMASVFTASRLPDHVVDNMNTYPAFKRSYFAYVNSLVSGLPPSARVLIFVVDRADCDVLESLLGRRVCVLRRGQLDIDPTASVYIATAVADAGLTIPSVDFVLSSAYTRSVDVLASASTVNVISLLPPHVITQRLGRTGRTNNGFFQLVKSSTDDFCGLPAALSTTDVAFNVLMADVPPTTLALVWPQSFFNLLFPGAPTPDSQIVDYISGVAASNLESFKLAIGQHDHFDSGVMTSQGLASGVTHTMSGDLGLAMASSQEEALSLAIRLSAEAANRGFNILPRFAELLLHYKGSPFSYLFVGKESAAAQEARYNEWFDSTFVQSNRDAQDIMQAYRDFDPNSPFFMDTSYLDVQNPFAPVIDVAQAIDNAIIDIPEPAVPVEEEGFSSDTSYDSEDYETDSDV